MNFDLYEFLKYHNGSKFYPVKGKRKILLRCP